MSIKVMINGILVGVFFGNFSKKKLFFSGISDFFSNFGIFFKVLFLCLKALQKYELYGQIKRK